MKAGTKVVQDRESDYEKAVFAHEIREEVGLSMQRCMIDQLGMAASTAKAYAQRLETYDVIADKRV